MIVTASKKAANASTSLPNGLDEFYNFVTLQDIVDEGLLPDMEYAQEFEAEQNEEAAAYGSHIIGYALAKEEYEDCLSNDGMEFLSVVEEDDTGRQIAGIFVNGRLMPTDPSEVGNILERYGFYDEDIEGATSEDLQKRFEEYTKKQNQVGKQLDDLQSKAKKKFGFGKSR